MAVIRQSTTSVPRVRRVSSYGGVRERRLQFFHASLADDSSVASSVVGERREPDPGRPRRAVGQVVVQVGDVQPARDHPVEEAEGELAALREAGAHIALTPYDAIDLLKDLLRT